MNGKGKELEKLNKCFKLGAPREKKSYKETPSSVGRVVFGVILFIIGIIIIKNCYGQ